MTATEAALSHLIDYAGLYPPAALDMQSAVCNYLEYGTRNRAWMLGRFIIDAAQLDDLRSAAPDRLTEIPLSVIAPPDADLGALLQRRSEEFRIECLEIKCHEPLTIARTCESVPADLRCYFEIPVRQGCSSAVDAIASVGKRAKLRMGGVVADAFPTADQIVDRLHLLYDRGVAFKATAGLHHPVRSDYRLTYAANSPKGTMHGFINMLCAAAAIRFGASTQSAQRILEEQDPAAFRVSEGLLGAHGFAWRAEQISEVRQFFTSFGSCSFAEPVQDLEALGWLPS